jgi:hypothetical protein
MYKIYIPINKKQKAQYRGLWQSPEGKLFYDYIIIKEVKQILLSELERIKTQYNQEAIFIEGKESAYIYYSLSKVEILKTKNSFSCTKKTLKRSLKSCLHAFNGCTIELLKKGFVLTAWSA